MKCILVLNGEMPEHPSANLLLDRLFGAEIVVIADRNLRDEVLREKYDEAAGKGDKPYLVPYGGSSPTGALGYAFAIEELVGQGVEVDWIVFGSSSGGTHAGFVLGQRIFGLTSRIIGISIDESEEWLKINVSALASQAASAQAGRFHSTLSLDRARPRSLATRRRPGQGSFGAHGREDGRSRTSGR